MVYNLDLRVKSGSRIGKTEHKIDGKRAKLVDIDAWNYLSEHYLKGLLS